MMNAMNTHKAMHVGITMATIVMTPFEPPGDAEEGEAQRG